MATFLDIGLFESFSPIFAFLFVWVTVFAILEFTKLFGETKGLHAMLAFILAVLTMLSPKLVQLISLMSPIFVVAMIFILFLLLLFRLFGAEESWFKEAITSRSSAFYWILIVAIVILVGSIATVYGQELLSITQGGEGNQTGIAANLGATLFHPKVLGFAVLMLIAVFTIYFLAAKIKET
jgi:hypothetical protein